MSSRKKLLCDLQTLCELEIVEKALDESSSSSSDDSSESSSESSESETDEILEFTAFLSSKRFLMDRTVVPKRHDWMEKLGVASDTTYRAEVRVTREGFKRIYDLICGHRVFQNESTNIQRPVDFQLAIALYRFGHYGNGASFNHMSFNMGLSCGAIELYTTHVITALLSLMPQFVQWPDRNEKRKIKRRFFQEYGFENCVGLVDGTLVVLDSCPSMKGADYFSRKNCYGLSAMVVSDDKKRILHAFTGFPGSAHDCRVYKHSSLAQRPEKFFEPEEYLLADSGYQPDVHVVPAYKAPESNFEENSLFNFLLAQARVGNEHCIGILKGRFQSLRGLRVMIKTADDHKKAVFWFLACCVLHNILHDMGDAYDETWTEDENVAETVVPSRQETFTENRVGRQKREKVKRLLLINKS
ncbi:putative nuclease HARBI1 [Paramacrobiotus metropolitanus]|uniref:putative nuclease HARBI1 n=1 Tax=Paramacrobiotus metropolitanus TaxID=2943436 RepID=UPI00244620E4|nr:putative nuclease HARBI1 [Paramacrobiotus metropolitanus]